MYQQGQLDSNKERRRETFLFAQKISAIRRVTLFRSNGSEQELV
jgi:hypothetical protein